MHNQDTDAVQVLIIDDERIYSDTIALQLMINGYNTVVKESGTVGLAYAASHPDIGVILLDLMMPDMYGLDVLSKLKGDPRLRDIPVILQTGSHDDMAINQGLQAGAFYCLRKPFNRQMLLEAVDGALRVGQPN